MQIFQNCLRLAKVAIIRFLMFPTTNVLCLITDRTGNPQRLSFGCGCASVCVYVFFWARSNSECVQLHTRYIVTLEIMFTALLVNWIVQKSFILIAPLPFFSPYDYFCKQPSSLTLVLWEQTFCFYFFLPCLCERVRLLNAWVCAPKTSDWRSDYRRKTYVSFVMVVGHDFSILGSINKHFLPSYYLLREYNNIVVPSFKLINISSNLSKVKETISCTYCVTSKDLQMLYWI